MVQSLSKVSIYNKLKSQITNLKFPITSSNYCLTLWNICRIAKYHDAMFFYDKNGVVQSATPMMVKQLIHCFCSNAYKIRIEMYEDKEVLYETIANIMDCFLKYKNKYVGDRKLMIYAFLDAAEQASESSFDSMLIEAQQWMFTTYEITMDIVLTVGCLYVYAYYYEIGPRLVSLCLNYITYFRGKCATQIGLSNNISAHLSLDVMRYIYAKKKVAAILCADLCKTQEICNNARKSQTIAPKALRGKPRGDVGVYNRNLIVAVFGQCAYKSSVEANPLAAEMTWIFNRLRRGKNGRLYALWNHAQRDGVFKNIGKKMCFQLLRAIYGSYDSRFIICKASYVSVFSGFLE